VSKRDALEVLTLWLAREDRTWAWLARQLGVSRQFVHRWRHDKRPSRKQRAAISKLTKRHVPASLWV
jgi:hypothetical protein